MLAWNTQDRCRVSLLPWSTSFEDPVPRPNGRTLLTLKDAADYITKLPKSESDLPEWQTAIDVLLLCSRGGHADLRGYEQAGLPWLSRSSKSCDGKGKITDANCSTDD